MLIWGDLMNSKDYAISYFYFLGYIEHISTWGSGFGVGKS